MMQKGIFDLIVVLAIDVGEIYPVRGYLGDEDLLYTF